MVGGRVLKWGRARLQFRETVKAGLPEGSREQRHRLPPRHRAKNLTVAKLYIENCHLQLDIFCSSGPQVGRTSPLGGNPSCSNLSSIVQKCSGRQGIRDAAKATPCQ